MVSENFYLLVKSTSSKSVPNIAKSAATLARSKTNASLRNGPSAPGRSAPAAVKRAAAPSEPIEAPATKQAKGPPKSGLLCRYLKI